MRRFFSFFTNLSFVGLCAYFWAAGVQTILYARWGEVKYPLQKWPKFLQFLHLLLQSTVITFRTCSRTFTSSVPKTEPPPSAQPSS